MRDDPLPEEMEAGKKDDMEEEGESVEESVERNAEITDVRGEAMAAAPAPVMIEETGGMTEEEADEIAPQRAPAGAQRLHATPATPATPLKIGQTETRAESEERRRQEERRRRRKESPGAYLRSQR